jgi:HEAT repeat protein
LVRAAGASEEAAQYIAGHCDQARCWLFLDALDEVAEPERLKAFWGVLRQWQTRVVLTSRPYAYEGRLPFQPLECRLAPFAARQTRALVERWYAGDSGRANPLLQTLRSSAGLEQMGQNPLLLTLVCWLAEDREITPDVSRSQLYEWMVRDLLSLDRHGSLDRAGLRGAQLLPLVREIGWRWFEANQGKKALPQGQLREWVWESCHRPLPRGVPAAQAVNLTPAAWADDLIEELAREKRFLTLFEWDRQPAYVFPHRSILEFLAGAELAEKLKGDRDGKWWDLVDRMGWDPGWEGVLLFTAGQLGERVNDLARRLLDGEDDVFRHRLALAAMCLAEAPQNIRHDDVVNRVAAEAWKVCSSEAKTNLDYPDHLRRTWLAAATLNGRIGGKTLLEHTIKEIRKGRTEAIRLAGRLGPMATRHPDLLDTLLEAVNGRKREATRAAVEALCELGESAAGHPGSVPALLRALRNQDWEVRELAAQGLGSLGEVAAERPDVIAALLAALDDDLILIEREVAKALRKLGGQAARRLDEIKISPALAELKSAWHMPASGIEVSMAIHRLTLFGEAAAAHPEVIPALLAALKAEDPLIRSSAALALYEVGKGANRCPEIIPALLAASSEEDDYVRSLAAVAAVEAGARHPEVIPVLLSAVRSNRSTIRSFAASALGSLAEAGTSSLEIVPVLVAALTDEDWGVRAEAAEALGKLGEGAAAHPDVIPALVAALRDRHKTVRRAAAEALGRLGKVAYEDRAVLAAILKKWKQPGPRLCLRLWDSQGLRIFRHRFRLSVRTIAELTQPSRT